MVFERLLLTVDLSSEVSVVIVGAKGLPLNKLNHYTKDCSTYFCAEVVDLVGEVPHLSFDLVCLSIILAQEGFLQTISEGWKVTYLCRVVLFVLLFPLSVTHPNKN